MMATKNPFQGDDLDFFAAARDESGEIKKETPKAEAPKAAAEAEPAKKQTFGQAFAAARRAGDKTFMFNGKSFSTAMASDKAKPAAKTAAPAAGRVGPTKERAAAMPKAAPKAEAPKPAAPAKSTRSVTAINPGVLRRTEADEKARADRKAAGDKARSEAKAAKATADKASAERLRNDPKQKELRAAREAKEKMSPAERSAERGRKLKEVLGMAKGGSVRGAGIEKRGMRKCKIV
jgi:hypothetical protein